MFKRLFEKTANVYDKQYKKLFLIPITILILCLTLLAVYYVQHGDFVSKGVSLKGGTTLSVSKQANVKDLSNYFAIKYPNADINVRSFGQGQSGGVIVEASGVSADDLVAGVETITGPLQETEYTVDTTGPSLGASFFKQAIYSIIVAFVLMAIVIYIYFREPLPSFYAVFCVFGDALFSLTVFNLFNMRLTTAGVAAFLMLIGYSVDTDILLTTRVLKRKEGTVSERMATAVPTGLTMSLAALAAVIVAYYSTSAESLRQIMFILGWGLVGDMIYTWLFNAALLRMYVERKEKKAITNGA